MLKIGSRFFNNSFLSEEYFCALTRFAICTVLPVFTNDICFFIIFFLTRIISILLDITVNANKSTSAFFCILLSKSRSPLLAPQIVLVCKLFSQSLGAWNKSRELASREESQFGAELWAVVISDECSFFYV